MRRPCADWKSDDLGRMPVALDSAEDPIALFGQTLGCEDRVRFAHGVLAELRERTNEILVPRPAQPAR
jgi:hypothetical protein